MLSIFIYIFQLVRSDLILEATRQLAADRQINEANSEVEGIEPETLSMDDDALLTIPDIHLAFEAIRSRLNLFGQLAQAWPDCVQLMAQCTTARHMVSLN